MKVMANQLAESGGFTPGLRNACFLLPPPPGTQPVIPGHLTAVAVECTPAPADGPGSPPAPAIDGASGRVEEAAGQPQAGLSGIGDLLNAAALTAPDTLAAAGYVQAADFAGQVEELARSIECLQLLAAGAVDRTRSEAVIAAAAARSTRSRGWVTGWESGVETLNETDADWPGKTTTRGTDHSYLRPSDPMPTEPAPSAATAAGGVVTPVAGTGMWGAVPVVTSPADDGCRNTAEFLRLRLRIPLREARRRLALADQALPGTSLTGEPLPPARPHLASALAPAPNPSTAGSADGATTFEETAADTGEETDEGTERVSPDRASAPVVSSYAGTIITAALDRIRHHTTPDVLDRIEHDLTDAAATADPDFVARLAQRWAETIDADGTEPSEEALRHTQGAFIRKPRHGLHRLEIFATTDQYEHLLTAMNAATNPRTTVSTETGTGAEAEAGAGSAAGIETEAGSGTRTEPQTDTGSGAAMNRVLAAASRDGSATVQDTVWNDAPQDASPDLERRTRPQKQLDGIIGAVKAGLTTNSLPAAGGNRPQIIATINYQDLFPHRPTTAGRQETGPWSEGTGGAPTGTDTSTGNGATTGANSGAATGTGAGTGTEASAGAVSVGDTSTVNGTGSHSGAGNFVFTGPVSASTLRKLACDADIIPAVLGTEGEILDLGRKTRLFTPVQRLALIARDQGCTFPNCTIPAPWCEAHHITYWSNGGPTTTSNGALLCSAHHHLVHKEQWIITSRHGTPWFTPPPHIDPQQKPQQNHYFRPPPPPRTQRV